jgi:poly-gamma-glutamate synthesis protein (capsule biosynthesis protein)
MKKAKQYVISIGLAAALDFVAAFFVLNNRVDSRVVESSSFFDNRDGVAVAVPVYQSAVQGKSFFDAAFAKASKSALEPPSAAASIVSPHHLLVADKIAALFDSVSSPNVETVVVFSPNHFSVGAAPILFSRGTWRTPYGDLVSDVEAVNGLLSSLEAIAANASRDADSPDVAIDELPFANEHGIGALAPFVARSFPNAKIVAALFDESAASSSNTNLVADAVRALFEERPDAFVVASIDFSHYLPTLAQSFHDEVSLASLRRGGCSSDCDNLDLEIDSNVVLEAMFEWNKLAGVETFAEAFHTSSLGIAPSIPFSENTSHVGGWFSAGKSDASSFLSFLFVGDIMLDRGVRLKLESEGADWPWRKISRWIDGAHFTIGNLEGTVNERASKFTYEPPFQFVFSADAVSELAEHVDFVSLANNHSWDVGSAGEIETRNRLEDIELDWFGGFDDPTDYNYFGLDDVRTVIIGYNAFAPDEAVLERTILTARAEADFVIVMPHWGVEYQSVHSREQERLARLMVQAGADLIIGSHPHVVQDVDVINGAPIIYSLGNFIFDQPFQETKIGLGLGVIIDGQSVILHLIPVSVNGGQPAPVSDAEAALVLDSLAKKSNPNLYGELQSGRLTVSRRAK